MKSLVLIVSAMLLPTLLLVGCNPSRTSSATPGMVNTACPFSGQPVGAGAPEAQWNGDTVGFCCAGCAMRWDGWSDERKDAFVSAQQ